MTSPGYDSTSPVPNPTAMAKPTGADEEQASVQAISEALASLDDVRELPVSEHVERFEAVHSALTDALNRAENLLSGSNGNGG
jgi:hypothetical protein